MPGQVYPVVQGAKITIDEVIYELQADGTFAPRNLAGVTVTVPVVDVATGEALLTLPTATVVDATGGVVRVEFTDDQTELSGIYRWNWVFDDGTVFPVEGYNLLRVQRSLG